jgi:AcrR family transcriptional regulator
MGALIAQDIEGVRVLAGSTGLEGAPGTERAMVYRRTHQVVKRLAARRSAILAAARDAAAEGGMAAVQIAPVAVRANVAAGTVYRYFPSKAELISELIAEV